MPRNTIDLGEERARALPGGGEVPGMPGWRWIHTPGHTPGHVCLFRPEDRVLLAGDALATVDADSFLGMLSRRQKISRPATPVTPDWDAAEPSVRQIATLRAHVLAPGHGDPMDGPTVAEDLAAFAERFAAPEHGRYAFEPARFDERGVATARSSGPLAQGRGDAGHGAPHGDGGARLARSGSAAWAAGVDLQSRRHAQANPVNAQAIGRG